MLPYSVALKFDLLLPDFGFTVIIHSAVSLFRCIPVLQYTAPLWDHYNESTNGITPKIVRRCCCILWNRGVEGWKALGGGSRSGG